ncbi:hypothetical protein GMA19_03055 [Paenibacillus polymyxa E681]|uniref:hypothetical protein n=2 Tax=Paenibacillus polymyxa TaxID=1406 RepID=UPI0001E31CBC|nr:hypothetical protein [Paenibacillus polymyxa]ADM70862.1 hypothetical protein PPE_03039 [Paenibacillus polymyxa E681]QNV57884.1 hypothetical protein GE561_03055 [Paenibacillus polymyxa E681]QNV62721.1 hypothetical protein GMA19_03055 [Paenibacillus polymyxa E681]
MNAGLLQMNEDAEDNHKIIQVNFFDDIEQDDIRKTKWLLNKYTDLVDVIKNYEYSLQQIENGMAAYDLLSAEGSVAKRVSGQELTADVTANAVILKDQRHINYKFYQFITNNVKFAINNMRDKHEGLISKLLFLDGMKYLKAQQYMKNGYRSDIPSISETTFADKRRRAIANIANSLKINRTLDFVTIDYGRGRNKEGEVGLRMPEVN